MNLEERTAFYDLLGQCLERTASAEVEAEVIAKIESDPECARIARSAIRGEFAGHALAADTDAVIAHLVGGKKAASRPSPLSGAHIEIRHTRKSAETEVDLDAAYTVTRRERSDGDEEKPKPAKPLRKRSIWDHPRIDLYLRIAILSLAVMMVAGGGYSISKRLDVPTQSIRVEAGIEKQDPTLANFPRLALFNPHGVSIQLNGMRFPAEDGMHLRSGHSIRTTEGIIAEVRYPDGSVLQLQANTELTLTSLSPGKSVYLQRGHIRASVAPQPRDAPFVFNSNGGRSIIRGTTLEFVHQPQATLLAVLSGNVTFERPTENGTETRDVSTSQMVIAEPRKPLLFVTSLDHLKPSVTAIGAGMQDIEALLTQLEATPEASVDVNKIAEKPPHIQGLKEGFRFTLRYNAPAAGDDWIGIPWNALTPFDRKIKWGQPHVETGQNPPPPWTANVTHPDAVGHWQVVVDENATTGDTPHFRLFLEKPANGSIELSVWRPFRLEANRAYEFSFSYRTKGKAEAEFTIARSNIGSEPAPLPSTYERWSTASLRIRTGESFEGFSPVWRFSPGEDSATFDIQNIRIVQLAEIENP